jgi:hypothetical protein
MTKKKTAVADPVLKKTIQIFESTDAEGKSMVIRLDESDRLFTLSGMTGEFWRLIDGKRSLSSIKGMLLKKHQPPVAPFEREIKTLTQKLVKNGLIKDYR